MMWGADMHIHTLYSHDSKETMEAYCQKAIALGIPSLCFTDHMDWFTHELPVAFDGLDGYFRELERLRKIYGEQLSILAGAEFGEPHVYEKKLQQLLQYPFDMVMASLHEIRDEQGSALVHLAKTQGWSLERAYRAYWNEMEIIAQMDGLDVIGHLDLPLRSYHALWMDDAQIQRIMRHLCDHHTAIEINTSALRKSASGELMPDRDLLTLYRQAGGLNVTLGSDAHCAEDLCAGFTKAMEVVQASGLCVGIVKRHVFIPVEDLC